MGIQGLLPLLKSIHKSIHLRDFVGQTLGIDAYGWLHRGTVSCAIELAQQKPTRKHIDFALSRVRMLIHFGVKPYLVFDGDYLPSKAHTERERAGRRKESKRLGLELLAAGRISQAHLELQKAIDVTPVMARELIEELKQLDVPYVVAPYEADSQLAYLEKQGIISGVLSEDSDLLVFGVKCLLTKLDQYGECVMVNRADFTACREISLVGWTDKDFRMMAMLSGCDYLPGIEKMGLKTAYRLVRKHKAIDRVVRSVQFDGKMKVPAGYLQAFAQAERTFLYQWVYCPEGKRLVNLNNVPDDVKLNDMPYLGKHVEADLAIGVAAGDLSPNSKQRLSVPKAADRLPASRRTIVQTPDDKQGKPISEFFKPKRTPLAELDPNSFTPSPSQQRLLQAQPNASWSTSSAQPMRPPSLLSAMRPGTPLSAPQPTRRIVSAPWPDRQRTSPKRQRLCSTDSMLAASMKDETPLQTATSRFFSKQLAEPSPSLRKPSARKKTAEFELWSDDSAIEAVADLAATQEPATISETPSPKKRKKLQVFVDPSATEGDTSRDTSQDTNAPQSLGETQNMTDDDTPATSFESNVSDVQQTVFSNGVKAGFAAMKSIYLFQPSAQNNVSRSKSLPLAVQSPLQELEQNSLLGRLAKSAPRGVNALNKATDNTLSANDQVDEHSAARRNPDETTDDIVEEDFIDDGQWLDLEQQKANIDSSPRVQGSEDLLVPNSPDSAEEDGRDRVKLNLQNFAFAGRC